MNGQAKDADKVPISAGKSVLIVSHSNVSVDGIIKKIVEEPDTDMLSYLKNRKNLRFGWWRVKRHIGKIWTCVKCSEEHFKYKI